MKKNSTISGHLQVNGHALDIEHVERDVVVVTIDGVAVEVSTAHKVVALLNVML